MKISDLKIAGKLSAKSEKAFQIAEISLEIFFLTSFFSRKMRCFQKESPKARCSKAALKGESAPPERITCRHAFQSLLQGLFLSF